MEPIIRKTYILFRNARDWLLAKFFFGFIAVLKLFPADSAIWFVSEAAKGLGMWYPRTKLARNNLKLAFPEKSKEEIESDAKLFENLRQKMSILEFVEQYDKSLHHD